MKTKMDSPLIQENLPSERSFGLLFSLIFFALGIYGELYTNWHPISGIVICVVGVLLVTITILIPKILSPFNRGWYSLGKILGKFVSPLVLGLIFFLLITPTALIGKVMGRDELKLKKRKKDTYWVDRNPDESSSDSFKNQF